MTDQVNGLWDQAKLQVEETLGIEDPLRILPYRGYGTAKWIYIKGRVLEKEGIEPLQKVPHSIRTWKNMYRQFESDEVPDA